MRQCDRRYSFLRTTRKTVPCLGTLCDGLPLRMTPAVFVLATLLCLGSLNSLHADVDPPKSKKADSLPSDGTRLLERMQSTLAGLVERVGPTVVAIQADRNPAGLGDREEWMPRTWVSTGTGVIIRSDGRILTSQHVIDGAVAIHVILHDGRRLRARQIAADRRSDLAIIRIDMTNLKAAELSDVRNIRRGHIVLALGNPLGLSSDGQAAVSHGLVSAIGRPLPETFGREEDRYYGDMIQTTAPIHPGNSGGPLVDIHGRVIGIITAVSTRSDGREGIGFAVPINASNKAIIDKLLMGQPIDYGYLGVAVDDLPESRRRAVNLPPGQGVLIWSVESGGPAAQAGLRNGDIVVTMDNESVYSVEQFVRAIGAAGPDRQVQLGYVRNARRKSVEVTLMRRPLNNVQQLPKPTLSFRGTALGAVEPMMRAMANLPENALLVLRVDAGSPAHRAGLTPGDIIIRIEGNPLTEHAVSQLTQSQKDVLLGLASGRSVIVQSE
ncbi:MAG: trypsin-like peptidase domain-containing protein [Phycisphaerales bacterium]|nr:trypsin-like peptidase domain-containing protein [Phycisphaerales bacterium]